MDDKDARAAELLERLTAHCWGFISDEPADGKSPRTADASPPQQ